MVLRGHPVLCLLLTAGGVALLTGCEASAGTVDDSSEVIQEEATATASSTDPDSYGLTPDKILGRWDQVPGGFSGGTPEEGFNQISGPPVSIEFREDGTYDKTYTSGIPRAWEWTAAGWLL